MRPGGTGNRLTKKTEGRKSCDTVSLRTAFQFKICLFGNDYNILYSMVKGIVYTVRNFLFDISPCILTEFILIALF
jgi:hypothetical protein